MEKQKWDTKSYSYEETMNVMQITHSEKRSRSKRSRHKCVANKPKALLIFVLIKSNEISLLNQTLSRKSVILKALKIFQKNLSEICANHTWTKQSLSNSTRGYRFLQ